MTIRERSKALATGPGEKLRKALGLGPEHSGTCAQLARAISQWKTESNCKPIQKFSGMAGGWPCERKLAAMEIRIRGLVSGLSPDWYCLFGGINVVSINSVSNGTLFILG